MNRALWGKKAIGVGVACAITIGANIVFCDTSDSVSNQQLKVQKEVEEIKTVSGVKDTEDEVSVTTTTTVVTESIPVMATGTKNPYSETATRKTNIKAVKKAQKDAKAVKVATKEKEKVSERWLTTGISIAKDYVNIRKSASTDSEVQGKLYRGSAAKILSTKGKWVKVESGSVKGYIKKSFLATGKKAEKLADKFATKYIKVKEGTVTLNVRKAKGTDEGIVAQIAEDESYQVQSIGEKWIKIKLDNSTKGYVSKDYVKVSLRFKKAVSIEEERAAEEREEVSEQTATQKTNGDIPVSSVKGSSLGEKIANYAKNFIGNPYQWGGTSLTNGADCSGFVLSVYAKFGYSLPHSSAAQAGYGKQVSLDKLQPGDLIFYKHGSRIGHVAIYIGGGRIVHAAGEQWGITTADMHYNTIYCAKRIVS